jgi:Rrf2 family protein
MLSKRVKYAIKTLLFLYENGDGKPISAKIISENEKIPYKFLENILRELRQNKILKSVRGAEGGYKFLKDPNEITVAEIIRIIDGPIALIPCASYNFYEKCDDCSDEVSCKIRKLFVQLRNEMLPILNKSITDLEKL